MIRIFQIKAFPKTTILNRRLFHNSIFNKLKNSNPNKFHSSIQNRIDFSDVDYNILEMIGCGWLGTGLSIGFGRHVYEKVTMGKLKTDLAFHIAENLLPLPEIDKEARFIQKIKWLIFGSGCPMLFLHSDYEGIMVLSSIFFAGITTIQIFARYLSNNRGDIIDNNIPPLKNVEIYSKHIQYEANKLDILSQNETGPLSSFKK